MIRNNPKISVIMSVYNGSRFLGQAIESIVKQSFTDWELIVMNDGSTEPIHDIISQFQDDRIQVYDQENQGLTKSLNRALEVARGPIVARMDSDDECDPERLKLQYNIMERYEYLALVGSHFDVIDEENRLLERKELIVDDHYRLWRLMFHNCYGHGSVMYRKDAVKRMGWYNAQIRYAQDYDLWSRLSTKTNTRIIPEYLYQYRLIETSNQVSVKNYDLQLNSAISISNNNIRRCNPKLGGSEVQHVRSLYWNFECETFSNLGLEKMYETFVGFVEKFRISVTERKKLLLKLISDLEIRVEKDNLDQNLLKNVVYSLQSWE